MNKADEIIVRVEKSWLRTEEIYPGEAVQVSLRTPPKKGDLVFVVDNDKNIITYYNESLKGSIYTILSVKSIA